MKSIFTSVAALLFVVACSSSAMAEDRVIEFWSCELKDGKTLEDAQRVNAKWLELQNGANPSAGIRSWGLSPIVGEIGGFGYLDSFPSLDAWAKSQATIQTAAGKAIEAELNAIASCSMNSLYQATEH